MDVDEALRTPVPVRRAPASAAAAKAKAATKACDKQPVEKKQPLVQKETNYMRRKRAAAAKKAAAEAASARPAENVNENVFRNATPSPISFRPHTTIPAVAAPEALEKENVEPQQHTQKSLQESTTTVQVRTPTLSTDESGPFGNVEVADNVTIYFMTSYTQQWRTLIDSIKDMLDDCPATFDKDGFKLISVDPGMVALINMQIKAETYFCRRPTTIGLNIEALYKILRNMTTGGYTLEFTITSDDPENMKIVIINNDKRTTIIHTLMLLDMPPEIVTIPPVIFPRILSMPSADFQRYVRELSSVGKQITIRISQDKLILSAKGKQGTTEIQIRPTASGMHWQAIEEDGGAEPCVTVGATYLTRFSRPLDPVVNLYIMTGKPLVLKYRMASAAVRLAISPCNPDAVEEQPKPKKNKNSKR